MDPKTLWNDGLGVVKLDEAKIAAVAKGPWLNALLILIIAGVLTAIGQRNWSGIIGNPIGYLIGLFVVGGILWLVARVFGGVGAYADYCKALAHTEILGWLGILYLVPVLGDVVVGLASLWGLVVAIIVTKVVQKVSTAKAVLIVLLPTAIILVLAFLFVATLFAAFLGGTLAVA